MSVFLYILWDETSLASSYSSAESERQKKKKKKNPQIQKLTVKTATN